ncbi:MAG: phosphoribosylglycinamide formyltransferase [Gemmatimonadetes bacterium]|nr:phosphoribosylglycinamide formyltransferase [Gemmatimonadota bacterium]
MGGRHRRRHGRPPAPTGAHRRPRAEARGWDCHKPRLGSLHSPNGASTARVRRARAFRRWRVNARNTAPAGFFVRRRIPLTLSGRAPIFAPLFPPAAGPELSTHARIAVLASGGGSNLQALIDRLNADPQAPARVELVVGSRAGIGAVQRAERAGIPAMALDARTLAPEAFCAGLAEALQSHGIDLIVLAGWLQLVPAEVVRRFQGRMINVHPALLPAFGGRGMYGMRVHRAVLESGVRVTGATVHFVDEAYDQGAVIAQWPVPVLPGDTPESLAARVLAVEHRILPLAVEALAREPAVPVWIQGEPLAFDLVSAPAPADASIRRTLRLAPGAAGAPGDPRRD